MEAYQVISEYGLEDAILRLSETSSNSEESYEHTSLAAMLSQYAKSVTVPHRDFLSHFKER